MPLSQIHQKRKYKNYTLLAIMFAVVILFFAITIVKIKYL